MRGDSQMNCPRSTFSGYNTGAHESLPFSFILKLYYPERRSRGTNAVVAPSHAVGTRASKLDQALCSAETQLGRKLSHAFEK
jgi:hypothetical protein